MMMRDEFNKEQQEDSDQMLVIIERLSDVAREKGFHFIISMASDSGTVQGGMILPVDISEHKKGICGACKAYAIKKAAYKLIESLDEILPNDDKHKVHMSETKVIRTKDF